MQRILFRWRNVPIYSYPAMLYLGLVLALCAQYYAASMVQLDSTRTIMASLILIVPALAGARLLFVLAHWDIYGREPHRIWRTSEGGLAMYGGFLLAVPVSIPVAALLGLPWGAYLDAVSFALLIGMSVTRLGCFLNGCCSGRATSGILGVYLPDQDGSYQRRIPTQLLEAAWALIVLIVGLNIWPMLPTPGALFLYTMGAYGAGRLMLETLRQERDLIFGLPFNQMLSAALTMACLVGFATEFGR
jgi:phosphatidylglycerol:prolipoprotein diacylglycerol transferase